MKHGFLAIDDQGVARIVAPLKAGNGSDMLR